MFSSFQLFSFIQNICEIMQFFLFRSRWIYKLNLLLSISSFFVSCKFRCFYANSFFFLILIIPCHRFRSVRLWFIFISLFTSLLFESRSLWSTDNGLEHCIHMISGISCIFLSSLDSIFNMWSYEMKTKKTYLSFIQVHGYL